MHSNSAHPNGAEASGGQQRRPGPRPTRSSCSQVTLALPSRLRLAFFALLLGAGTSCNESARKPERKPDVLFLVIDTLRADRLGCYGYPRPTSPNLDALAEGGVLCERVSAQSSWTLPSMSSLLAGQYLTAHRTRPDPAHTLLAESFQAAGYRTLGVVANTLLRAEDGFARGFDQYRVCDKGKTSFDDILQWLEAPLAAAARPGENGEREPLFLYVHAFDPHTPYLAHPEYDAELPVREALPFASEDWRMRMLNERGPTAPSKDPQWKKALAELQRRRGLYDQEVRYSDDRTGRLLARLGELGFAERLIVAVVADHGEGLWDQLSRMDSERLRAAPPDSFFFGGHGQDLSQQALFTPFLLAGPGLPQGMRLDLPVENIDLYPTLLHLADIALPAGLDGRDLVPAIRGAAQNWREETYSFVIHAAGVVAEKERWKLVTPLALLAEMGASEVAPATAGIELYNLEHDPLERENLATQHPERVHELLQKLRRWVAAHPTQRNGSEAVDAEFLQAIKEAGYAGSLVGEEEDADGH